MIYFVQEGFSGSIKIGSTTDNALARIKALQTANSNELRLLGYMPGGAKAEHSLHDRFSEDNIRGEWFNPSLSLLDFIKGNTKKVMESSDWEEDVKSIKDARNYRPFMVSLTSGQIDLLHDLANFTPYAMSNIVRKMINLCSTTFGFNLALPEVSGRVQIEDGKAVIVNSGVWVLPENSVMRHTHSEYWSGQ